MRRIGAALLLVIAAAGLREDASAGQSGAAFFIRSLDNPRDRREARADILDTPVFSPIARAEACLARAIADGKRWNEVK